MKKIFLVSIWLTIGILFASDNGKIQNKPIDPANMDLSVSPADDFYQYANGSWMKNNPVPDDKSAWTAFHQLIDKNMKMVRTLFYEVSKAENVSPDSLRWKIKTFYNLGLDEEKIEKDGIAPLQTELNRIQALSNKEDLMSFVAHSQIRGTSPLFALFPRQDEKNSSMVIATLYQGGLGLADRDYYVSEDKKYVEMRAKYLEHITKMFQLAGIYDKAAAKKAERVLSFETRLAKASLTRLENRDPHKTYNKMNLDKLVELGPGFDWKQFFREVGLANPGDINVAQPRFFTEVGKMMNDVSLDDWKTFLSWKWIVRSAPYLNRKLVDENFNFYQAYLSGKKVNEPRWKRVSQATNYALGEAIGKLYVEKYFPPEAKERMLKLVAGLREALKDRIQQVDWMSDETKHKAVDKLAHIQVKIGYPDKWRDYTKLVVKQDSYFQNVLRASEFNFNHELGKIGKEVDRGQWHMNPQVVNAYYNPNSNEIVFPAAILQFPFFDMNADDAFNYGGIGVVIGHEMTHGFDDQGRQYDAKGNLKEWWLKADAEKFKKAADVLVKQYDSFDVGEGEHVNGSLTLGENIADLGGVIVAYNAFKNAIKGKPVSKIDGFTPEQRFFLAFAQLWRGNIRPQALLRQVKEDVHSPARFRVLGSLKNFAPFFEAFDIKEGDPMYLPEKDRAKIW
ncbi:MAG: peptidase M13 [Acidobacteria bacterium]|nr:MAG: peptidase M13 [Acidobacteriota bacterium]